MGIDILDIGPFEPLVVFAEMKQVPVCFNEHSCGHVMRQLRFQVVFLTVSADLCLLVLLLFVGLWIGLLLRVLQWVKLCALGRNKPGRRISHQLILNLEGLDINQPPVTCFILDKVPDHLRKADSPVQFHIISDCAEVLVSFSQMFSLNGFYDSWRWWFSFCAFPDSYDQPFGLWLTFIVVTFFVCD